MTAALAAWAGKNFSGILPKCPSSWRDGMLRQAVLPGSALPPLSARGAPVGRGVSLGYPDPKFPRRTEHSPSFSTHRLLYKDWVLPLKIFLTLANVTHLSLNNLGRAQFFAQLYVDFLPFLLRDSRMISAGQGALFPGGAPKLQN